MPNPVICEAINQFKMIEFTYEDNDGNVHRRVVEPYAYGQTSRGNEALRGYQIGGTSESTIPGWKLFVIERIGGLRRTDRSFNGNAPGYAHGDSALSPIYCRVP